MPTFSFPRAPPRLTARLPGTGDAPLPMRPKAHPTASAARFMPVHYPYPPARLVSCYALFERMAASKPTSQLSVQADLVSAT